jgi:hypothetical protein
MSDISQLPVSIWWGGGGEGEWSNYSPYHYTTWLSERGQGGELSSLP